MRSKVGTTLAFPFAAGCAEPRFGKYDLVLQFYNGNLQLVFVHIYVSFLLFNILILTTVFGRSEDHHRRTTCHRTPSRTPRCRCRCTPACTSAASCGSVRLSSLEHGRSRRGHVLPRGSVLMSLKGAPALPPPLLPLDPFIFRRRGCFAPSIYLSLSIYRRLKQTRRGIGNVGNIQCGISSISIPRRSTAQHTARYDAQHLHHRLHRN